MNLCCATCIHKGDRVDGSQGEFTCLANYWPIKSIPELRKDPNMSLVQRILSLFKSHEPPQEAVTVFEHLTVKENCSCTRWEGRS
jgi:hypothetical protein